MPEQSSQIPSEASTFRKLRAMELLKLKKIDESAAIP